LIGPSIAAVGDGERRTIGHDSRRPFQHQAASAAGGGQQCREIDLATESIVALVTSPLSKIGATALLAVS
jgi:hypothetical protein